MKTKNIVVSIPVVLDNVLIQRVVGYFAIHIPIQMNFKVVYDILRPDRHIEWERRSFYNQLSRLFNLTKLKTGEGIEP